jgi:hypothetical protein
MVRVDSSTAGDQSIIVVDGSERPGPLRLSRLCSGLAPMLVT